MAHSVDYEHKHGGVEEQHVYIVGSKCIFSDVCLCEPTLAFTAPNGDKVWKHKGIRGYQGGNDK